MLELVYDLHAQHNGGHGPLPPGGIREPSGRRRPAASARIGDLRDTAYAKHVSHVMHAVQLRDREVLNHRAVDVHKALVLGALEQDGNAACYVAERKAADGGMGTGRKKYLPLLGHAVRRGLERYARALQQL